MKNFVGAAAIAAAVLVGSTVSSQALTYQFPSDGGFTYGNTSAVGTLNDKFKFSVSMLTDFSASLTNSTNVIKNLVLSLFTSAGTKVSTTDIGMQSDVKGNQTRAIGASLTSGSYYVQVSGIGPSKTSYTGNINLSAVPLPGTVALFGTAIAALGVAGAARKRKTAAAV